MGNEAENLDQITPEPIETEDVEVVEIEGEEKAKDEETQPQFTQQQLDEIVSKRVNKLNRKVDESKTAVDKTGEELALARERIKLLELARQQAIPVKSNKAPDPDDFDGGEYDPNFKKKQEEYNQYLIDQRVEAKFAESTKKAQDEALNSNRAKELEGRQRKHYQLANELEIKNYAESEDKALDALGNETVNHIIENFDDSPAILNYLGLNDVKAKQLAELIKTHPIKAVAEIGRISKSLEVKSKSTNAPDPVENLEGSSSFASKRSTLKGATFS